MNKKVLHISHAYPTKINAFDGDFVQRHYSLVKDESIYLLHVQFDPDQKVNYIISDNELEKELIIYIPSGNIISRGLRYCKAYLKGFNILTKRYGKPELIHVHFSLHTALVANIIKLKHNIEYIVTEHSTVYSTNSLSLKVRLLRLIGRIYLYNVKRILPVSEDLANHIPISKDKTVVIPNAVASPFFNKPQRSKDYIFTFIHVSSFDEDQKNITGILDAISNLNDLDFKFTFIGNTNHQYIKSEIKKRNLDKSKIIVKGPLSNTEVAFEMLKSDVFILFSRYENLPCVLLEAQCTGLYCISSNVGGISEIIDEEYKGVLVESENINQLSTSMRYSYHLEIKHDRIAKSALSNYSQEKIRTLILNQYKYK